MNELPDDVPVLSAEASEFLKRHATTGEPSLPALQRVRERLPTPRARLVRFARVAAPLAAGVAVIVLGIWSWTARREQPQPSPPVAETPVPPQSEPAIPVMTLVDESPSQPEPVPAPRPDPKSDELREIYLQAYMLKDTNPAKSRQLLERILAKGDPRSDTYQKAKAQLDAMGEDAL